MQKWETLKQFENQSANHHSGLKLKHLSITKINLIPLISLKT